MPGDQWKLRSTEMMRLDAVKRPPLTLLLLTLFITVPIRVEGATATGYVPFSCPMNSHSKLHLTLVDGHRLKRELVLLIPESQFWGVVDPKDWYENPGEDCSSDRCEPIAHSRVQIVHISNTLRLPFRRVRTTGISGNFEIELRDGRKIAGSFSAKVPKPPKGAGCA